MARHCGRRLGAGADPQQAAEHQGQPSRRRLRLYAGRDVAIQDVNSKWSVLRTAFQNRNITAALADPQFQAQIVALIDTNIQARPDDFRARATTVIATVTSKRPPGDFDAANAVWGIYYRALIGVALDACGPEVVASLAGFAWP